MSRTNPFYIQRDNNADKMTNQPAHHGLERTLSNSSASTVRHSAYSSPRDSQWSEDASRENTGYARASEPRRYYNGPQQMAQSQARTAIPQPLQRNSLTSNNQGNPYSDRPQRAMSPAPGQSGRDDVPWGGPFPSLHLWPMNETFPTKMIHLPPCLSRVGGERVSQFLNLRLEELAKDFLCAASISMPPIPITKRNVRSRSVVKPMPKVYLASGTDFSIRKC
jgi:hypothetical protein